LQTFTIMFKMRILIAISLTTILSSCLFDSDSDTIIGDYKTGWIDIPQTRRIKKGAVIVPAYVSAIGHNLNFIIAKQQPIKNGNVVTVHTDSIYYYVITISDNTNQDKEN
jgi:hypothetical protein